MSCKYLRERRFAKIVGVHCPIGNGHDLGSFGKSVSRSTQIGIEHEILSNPRAGEIAELMLISLSISHGQYAVYQLGRHWPSSRFMWFQII